VADKAEASATKAPPAKEPPAASTPALKQDPGTTPISNGLAAGSPPGVIELQGQPKFNASAAWKEFIASSKKPVVVPVQFGKLAHGELTMKRNKDDTLRTVKDGKLALAHPFFEKLPIAPYLAVEVDKDAIKGRIAVPGAGDIFDAISDSVDALNMVGFSLKKPAKPTNEIQNGNLVLDAPAIPLSIAGWLNGSLQIGLVNDKVTLKGNVAVKVKGLAEGSLDVERLANGTVSGKATIAANIAKFSGTVSATYLNGAVSITGTLTYTTEKLKGSVTVVVMEAAEAEKKAREQIDPANLVSEETSDADKKPEKFKKGERGVAGWGELDFAFTDWFTGKAKAIFGPAGYITIVGKIAPPKSVELMKEKPFNTRLFGADFTARYGVPYVADIHVGFGISLGASARIGPATLSDIVVEGVYSTDPTVLNKFAISGAFRISAYAGLNLRFEGKAGLTVLGHDVDLGAAITGKAGVKGYAEARPELGYREKADPVAGKKGEYYLKGHLEIAAQPFVGLEGELFVRLDSPWWSPAPDKTWTWPLFSLEYPLPGEFGIGADVDYVIGSDQWPTIKWGKADFDASKFTDSLLDDKIPAKKVGGDVPKAGKWQGEPAPPPTAPPAPAADGAKAPGAAQPKAGAPKPVGGKGGGQTPDEAANVPKTADTSKRWLEGMKALGELHERAEKDPEDAGEIARDLGKIKAAHGFVKLDAHAEGDYWLVEAELNPKIKPKKSGNTAKTKIKKDPKAADQTIEAGGEDEDFHCTWTVDDKGRLKSATATLRKVKSKAKRSSAETTAQGKAGKSSGKKGDVGGHAFGHRFVGDQGPKNLFPQEGKFNNSAYKKLENEWADWIKHGHHVTVELELSGGTDIRPDAISIYFVTTNPTTKVEVHERRVKFTNDGTTTYVRMASGDIPFA
jgi:hypothetical protein